MARADLTMDLRSVCESHVFLPANVTSLLGIHAVHVLSAWERKLAFRASSAACTSLPESSRSGSCTWVVRRWIWWREWKRESPIFFLNRQILSGIGSSFCGFFPPGRQLNASPVFLREYHYEQHSCVAELALLWYCGSSPAAAEARWRLSSHGSHMDRTWIWQTGWKRARPISTCIPQI